jgi:hypothetical protein
MRENIYGPRIFAVQRKQQGFLGKLQTAVLELKRHGTKKMSERFNHAVPASVLSE